MKEDDDFLSSDDVRWIAEEAQIAAENGREVAVEELVKMFERFLRRKRWPKELLAIELKLPDEEHRRIAMGSEVYALPKIVLPEVYVQMEAAGHIVWLKGKYPDEWEKASRLYAKLNTMIWKMRMKWNG